MYKDYNDNELIYLIGEKNEEASNILYEKYSEVVNMKAKKYVNYAKNIGLDYSDLIQEGMVGLTEAIKYYKEQRDTTFSTFANICIEREIISALKKLQRKKHAALNNSLSLDYSIDENGKTILDFICTDDSDPSIKLENEDELRRIYDYLDKELTKQERQVFNLKMYGFEYKEIARLLNKSYKSIDSTLQRIKLKISKMLTK